MTRSSLFILRHGESLEDVDKTAYERIPDEEMPLSPRGVEQALETGLVISQEIEDRHVKFLLSPSRRVQETAHHIASRLLRGSLAHFHTLECMRKQEWGVIPKEDRSKIERERYEVGVLRYNFPTGETAEAYLNRFRELASHIRKEDFSDGCVRVIITHGFELRVALMILLGWTEDFFESLAHPRNCEIKRLGITRPNEFVLLNEMRVFDPTTNPNFIARKK